MLGGAREDQPHVGGEQGYKAAISRANVGGGADPPRRGEDEAIPNAEW